MKRGSEKKKERTDVNIATTIDPCALSVLCGGPWLRLGGHSAG